jgi:hypothetical protein
VAPASDTGRDERDQYPRREALQLAWRRSKSYEHNLR